MLRDPAILILDEATSAVDIEDEVLIRKAIEEFSQGRTTFVISHNLASIQVADRIVLMNGGRIEAVGTDHELKSTSALYRRLHEIHYHIPKPAEAPRVLSPGRRRSSVPGYSTSPVSPDSP